MKVLVSPRDVEEAIESLKGNADIIDVKNPKEGSLGANFPWVIKSIVELVKKFGKEVSATTGDMPFKPGTASLAALGAAVSGVDYIKVGLYGVKNSDEAYELIKAVVKAVKDYDPNKKVVAAAYADFYRISAIDPLKLPEVGAKAKVDIVMIDTAIKDGTTLFDHMDVKKLREFVNNAHEKGMLCALAGNLKWEHIGTLKELAPDVIGVRTMVCENGRDSRIKSELVEKLVRAVHE